MQRFLHIPFVQHLATLQVGSVMTGALGFLQSILFARLLGLEGYGVLAIVSAFAGLTGIVTVLGQQHTALLLLAERWGRKDRVGMEEILRSFLQMTLLCSVLAIVVILLAPLVTHLIYADASIGRLAQLLLLSTTIDLLPAIVFIALQVANRFRLLVVLESSKLALQLLLSTLFLLLGYGVLGVCLGALLTSLLSAPILLVLYAKQAQEWGFPAPRSSLRNITGKPHWPVIFQGLWIAIERQVGGNIYPNAFFFILSLTANAATVGLFRLALRLAWLPNSFLRPNISRLASSTLPKMFREGAAKVREACLKLIRSTAVFQIILALAAIVLIPPLVPFIYGEEFSGVTLSFILLSLAPLLTVVDVATVPLLRFLNRVQAMLLANLTSIPLALISYFLFLLAFSPLTSISLAVVTHFASRLWLPLYTLRLLSTPLPSFVSPSPPPSERDTGEPSTLE